MGKIIVNMFLTLDGVMQAPGAPDEDREGGFRHGGWQAPYSDNESDGYMLEHLSRSEALLLGRKTYDIFAAYWPKQDDTFARILNRVPKYVVSRSPGPAPWRDSTRITGDVVPAIAALRERHAQIDMFGSADLIQTLFRHDLVGRLEAWVYPVVLGTGKRLFVDGTVPSALRLVAPAQTFPKGGVLLRYERAGAPTYGDMTKQPAT